MPIEIVNVLESRGYPRQQQHWQTFQHSKKGIKWTAPAEGSLISSILLELFKPETVESRRISGAVEQQPGICPHLTFGSCSGSSARRSGLTYNCPAVIGFL